MTPSRGLREEEAKSRLARDGPNVLAAVPPTPVWRRLLTQLRSTVVLMLLAASAISLAIWLAERDGGLPYGSIAILAIVLVNAVLSLVQEMRAESAVAALVTMSAPEATVVRDAVARRIPARDVVVGDLILVEEGDIVPADARLVGGAALRVAEAVLTGESVAVDKDPAAVAANAALGDRTDMLFSGTTVVSGRGRAEVVATGMQTQIGRVAGMLEELPLEETPLQRELDHLGSVLGAIVLGLAAVMIAVILTFNGARGFGAVMDVLLLGVALAVAAVPEGLPAIVTAVLAVGVQRMARRNAIVRRLAAVETLGSTTVIASDKTGTLTTNEMVVRLVVTASGRTAFGGTGPGELLQQHQAPPAGGPLHEELERALTAATLANNASVHHSDGGWRMQGDPTEIALLVAAHQAGIDPAVQGARWPRARENPFSSERKLMSTVHGESGPQPPHVLFAKGAPDVLLRRCSEIQIGSESVPMTESRRAELLTETDEMSAAGLRTIAIAYRPLGAATASTASARTEELDDEERNLVLLGVVGMIDPPRPHAREAVARARDAGVRSVLITGDHPRTAAVIARELGISSDDRVLTGNEIDALPDALLRTVVAEVCVFARVDPAHKLRIVRALQANGEVVAMTGDGVNDAPALRAADIGIAMGRSGTDVAREAADMVLADDDFATIVAAIEEGRGSFYNIRRSLYFLLSGNLGEVVAMFLAVVAAGVLRLRDGAGNVILPLLAAQILWINLVTDGAPALALGMDAPEPELMRRRPRGRSERLVPRRAWRGIAWLGLIMGAGTVAVFQSSLVAGELDGNGGLAHARSMAFTVVVLFQMFNLLGMRSDTATAFARLSRARWVWGAIALSILLQLAVLMLPPLQTAFGTTALTAADWMRCLAVASSVLWARELAKLLARARAPGGNVTAARASWA